MSDAFKAGEVTQGEMKLLDWVGKSFGPGARQENLAIIRGQGGLVEGSTAFEKVRYNVGLALYGKIKSNGLGMAAVGATALPVMMAMAVVGFAAAPVLAAGAVGAGLGVAGMAVMAGSAPLAEKLALRRLNKAMRQPAPKASAPAGP